MSAAVSVQRASDWTDLVFHVLAHVPSSVPLAPSLHDSTYVAWAAQHLGPSARRGLATDAAALGAACVAHDSLARLSWIAVLFSDLSQAFAAAEIELGSLSRADVASPSALHAVAQDPASEVVRCAAYLEAPHWSSLPAPTVNLASLRAQLRDLVPTAPLLSRLRVYCSPALRLRGRAFDDRIWVGCPGPELGVDLEHVAYQAAHEATVVEIQRLCADRGEGIDFAPLEHAALLLLATRARAAGREAAHRKWLSHLCGVPALSRAALDPSARAAFDALS